MSDSRLRLPDVTVCAATSVNLAATVSALQSCLRSIEFADCLLFTDSGPSDLDPAIRHIRTEPMRSGSAYSRFVLEKLGNSISTSHALIVQWDGFVCHPDAWDPEFLQFDYIGAPWPQFTDGHDVGNGGFSLRSRKLLKACQDSRFTASHPEDVAIGRLNRDFLENAHGIRFARQEVAKRFSFERGVPDHETFGFHGVFNMISVLGTDRFWEIYKGLDDKSTAFVDYPLLYRQLGARAGSTRRRFQLTKDRLTAML